MRTDREYLGLRAILEYVGNSKNSLVERTSGKCIIGLRLEDLVVIGRWDSLRAASRDTNIQDCRLGGMVRSMEPENGILYIDSIRNEEEFLSRVRASVQSGLMNVNG